jgi:hypothetical protein
MLTISAILAVHNGAQTVGQVLKHLAANAIDVHVLDDGSTDRTPEILQEHLGAPVASITTQPFGGVFQLAEQLRWKAGVIETLTSDWVIHVDADEILESPHDGQSLRAFIEFWDNAGFDVLDCDEFVFVVVSEAERHRSADFRATMRRYYHYAPPGLQLHRAYRRLTGPPEWTLSGGHKLALEFRTVAPEKIRKRHYVGLSHAALQALYLSRVFSGEELRRNWHLNRIATTPDFVRLPPAERTFDLDVDGWRTDRPESNHLIFHQPETYRPPEPLIGGAEQPAMPFVVGVPRSGTTLLRLFLDAHPDLAIPPETQWLGNAIESLSSDVAPEEMHAGLKSINSWRETGVDEAAFDRLMAQSGGGPDPYEFIRQVYRFYAARFGAGRVGDKTPGHGLIMQTIAKALPEAHFIHIIRDGRDVAVSQRNLWFGPGNDPADAARFWTWRIREMRQQAQFLPHYMEVRYEALVADPEPVLQAIGAFIGLPFDPRQLDYHKTAAARLAELGDIPRDAGTITAAERHAIHELTLTPPQLSRVGRWRQEMSRSDADIFEQIAGNMLRDLGYDVDE